MQVRLIFSFSIRTSSFREDDTNDTHEEHGQAAKEANIEGQEEEQ